MSAEPAPRWKAAATIAFLALAACQPTPNSDDGVAVSNAATGNDTAAMLALPKGQQGIVLFRAVRDAGVDCQGLTDTKRLDDLDGRPAWFVTCDRRSHWLVILGSGGIAQVTDARRVRGIGQ